MRLGELSARSGLSTATIKFYLREGLVPPGRRVTATRAEYDEEHVRRLRLVRALIQVGRVPVATAREVLAHIDDESLGRTMRLGAALWALPQHGPEPEPDDPEWARAAAELDGLLERLGWSSAREIGALSPAYRAVVSGAVLLRRLGYPADTEQLEPYARKMMEVAGLDLDALEEHPTTAEQAEAAVSAAVLVEPLLMSVRRLAQEEESARRYGIS